MRPELDSALDAGAAQLVLDLSRLTFMDSSGLQLLVVTRDEAARRGIRFSLNRGPAIVTRALELTGLQDRFEFV